MAWYKRSKKNILTSPDERIKVPDSLWTKCPKCSQPTHIRDLQESLYVCPHCDYHYRIGSDEFFEILFGDQKMEEIAPTMESVDPLGFVDTKPYPIRIKQAQEKTGLKDAVKVVVGNIGDHKIVCAAMDFRFIGGSMGSVVGEKISRGIDKAIEEKLPLLIISRSGGARMMEGLFSLMQMAKISAKLALYDEVKKPYISLMTDPTTGGVSASFAMLGDINLAEPNALIGFAGPRVIKETIKKDLPEGFQRAEFLLEKGFIDAIVHRHHLKEYLKTLLDHLLNENNYKN